MSVTPSISLHFGHSHLFNTGHFFKIRNFTIGTCLTPFLGGEPGDASVDSISSFSYQPNARQFLAANSNSLITLAEKQIPLASFFLFISRAALV